MKQLFKKIFDLDPNEVEAFVKNLMVEQVKRNGGDDEYLKDYDIVIRWIVTDNSFYVFLEPKLKTEDYKHFYFKDKKELTAGEYFRLTYNHEHYEFPEVYGLMTGETTFNGEVGIWPDPEHPVDYDRILAFYYHKEYTQVCHKTDGTWYISDWDDVADKEVRKPVPADLIAEVLKVVSNDRN